MAGGRRVDGGVVGGECGLAVGLRAASGLQQSLPFVAGACHSTRHGLARVERKGFRECSVYWGTAVHEQARDR